MDEITQAELEAIKSLDLTNEVFRIALAGYIARDIQYHRRVDAKTIMACITKFVQEVPKIAEIAAEAYNRGLRPRPLDKYEPGDNNSRG